jgi:heat shock protein HtpX
MRAAARGGQRLLEDMLGHGATAPRWTAAKLAALALAALVYLFTVFCLVLGVYWIYGVIIGDLFFVMLFPAVFLIGWAFLGYARPEMLERRPLERAQAPALHALVEDIVRAQGGKLHTNIVLDANFNASFGQYGWTRTPVLTLGLPLWDALEPQERVALLAHEIAHGLHGDTVRSAFFWGAVRTLERWHAVFDPEHFGRGDAISNLLRLPFYPLIFAVSGLAWLWLHALAALSYGEAQRAEYLADAASARCAGTRAAVSLQWKILLGGTASAVAHHLALSRQTAFFAAFAQARAGVPQRELERLQRVSALEGTRPDHTHPQNRDRQRVLDAHRIEHATVHLSPSLVDAIEGELQPFRGSIEREVVSRHRDHLYAG